MIPNVFGTHVVRREDGDEFGGSGGLFYIGTTVGFLAFYETHHSDDLESEFPCGFDGLDGGAAGGANIVDDDDASALFAEALDALSGAVLLFRFANKETLERAVGRNRSGDYDRIGAHGKSTDGLREPALGAHFFHENLSGKTRTECIERRSSAVNVVVAAAAGGEFELAQAEGFFREQT